MTGKWNLDLIFKNAMHIEADLKAVLAGHGYQNDDPQGDSYLRIGVNWGYTGAQLSDSMDPMTVIAIAALLLLIIFTGYLIIYNVFQISVTNDIRFYGLLKTIGTTGRQIKHIIRQQALLLSLIGIPVGLLLGFIIGNKLTPVIMSNLNYKSAFVSFNPLIFIGAALFSLLTVFLSCARPGKMAAKVSPVEAVRYTEGGGNAQRAGKREKVRRAQSGASLTKMAWANLGRSRSKTVVTVLSLTLAVVLATITYTFSTGFDMNKYLTHKANVDFILGSAAYFQSGTGGFDSTDEEVPEEIIADVNAQGGIEDGGRIYGKVSDIDEFVTEDWYRSIWGRWNAPETVDWMVERAQKQENGMLEERVQLYGMEELPLRFLTVLEGDLTPLSDPSQNAVAAVYFTDDYNNIEWNSHWARLGDTVTFRYVTRREHYYTDTGEIIEDSNNMDSSRPSSDRAVGWEDRDYTVCALVAMPNSISYRYYGADEFVMGAEQFKQDTGTSSVMTYIFNTAGEAEPEMESFLADYTESVQPLYNYESRAIYEAEFEGFKRMFATLGGTLSLIIGLVGVLNFINAILTGILARKRELAVLQSVGMTGKQLKTMLVCEGLYYTVLALLVSLAMTLCLGPLVGSVVGDIFWFFTYHLTVTPILAILPAFLLLGALVPLWTYRSVARRTIVERLREVES